MKKIYILICIAFCMLLVSCKKYDEVSESDGVNTSSDEINESRDNIYNSVEEYEDVKAEVDKEENEDKYESVDEVAIAEVVDMEGKISDIAMTNYELTILMDGNIYIWDDARWNPYETDLRFTSIFNCENVAALDENNKLYIDKDYFDLSSWTNIGASTMIYVDNMSALINDMGDEELKCFEGIGEVCYVVFADGSGYTYRYLNKLKLPVENIKKISGDYILTEDGKIFQIIQPEFSRDEEIINPIESLDVECVYESGISDVACYSDVNKVAIFLRENGEIIVLATEYELEEKIKEQLELIAEGITQIKITNEDIIVLSSDNRIYIIRYN